MSDSHDRMTVLRAHTTGRLFRAETADGLRKWRKLCGPLHSGASASIACVAPDPDVYLVDPLNQTGTT